MMPGGWGWPGVAWARCVKVNERHPLGDDDDYECFGDDHEADADAAGCGQHLGDFEDFVGAPVARDVSQSEHQWECLCDVAVEDRRLPLGYSPENCSDGTESEVGWGSHLRH